MKKNWLLVRLVIVTMFVMFGQDVCLAQQQDTLSYSILTNNRTGEKYLNVYADIYNTECVGQTVTVYFYSMNKNGAITEKTCSQYLAAGTFYTFNAEYASKQLIKVYKKVESGRRIFVGTIKVPDIH